MEVLLRLSIPCTSSLESLPLEAILLRVGASDPHPHLSWASSCRPIPSVERRASACLGAVGAGAS